MKPKVLLSWSTGKDSAWTLYMMRQSCEWDITGLVTTVNTAFGRVSMHGVREELLEQQARAAGLPLWKVPIPYPCPNEVYERAMHEVVLRAKDAGVTHFAFGDLFLQDVRDYRERQLSGTGIQPVFPLWGIDTAKLAQDMIASGLRAVVTCVDPQQIPAPFIGREFDEAFLRELPPSADPCGENGEYHTFCYAGPMFTHPIAVRTGEVVERDGFVYMDVYPSVTAVA
ncbi:MAG: ATP-binding protein [Armatimonadota bacterium]|nr:adenine nucleotide alpha hydrolase [bacterium]MDW8320370.1 ATP-binding protein [Armatimonadota bacterium]